MRVIRRPVASASLAEAILEDAELVAAVQTLEPGLFGELVRHVGLADSGDLLSLATAEQLRGLADDELWGDGDGVDAERFAIWVEVLVDAGGALAADTLADLDEDLLAHAISQHVIVLDMDRLGAALGAEEPLDGIGDRELAEKIMEASLSHELDELLILSVRESGWDALIEVIHQLDRRDHAMVRRVLERVCDASMSRVAAEGLYAVLSEAETLAEDARGGRDDRRERRGFVASHDARAFLELARERPEEAGADPVTRSYDRNFAPAPSSGPPSSRLAAFLRERGVEPRPRLLPGPTSESAVRATLAQLRESDPELHARRLRELIYLANVLAAGCALDGEPLQQVDAIAAALAIADAGLAPDGADAVERRGLIPLFARGWSRAHDREGSSTGSELVSRLSLRSG